jgi:hypothetical protein
VTCRAAGIAACCGFLSCHRRRSDSCVITPGCAPISPATGPGTSSGRRSWGKMQAKRCALIAALDGRFDDHHAELAWCVGWLGSERDWWLALCVDGARMTRGPRTQSHQHQRLTMTCWCKAIPYAISPVSRPESRYRRCYQTEKGPHPHRPVKGVIAGSTVTCAVPRCGGGSPARGRWNRTRSLVVLRRRPPTLESQSCPEPADPKIGW